MADLVEEDAAPVGELEEAGLAALLRAGEGPVLVAEELALDEVVGEGAQVHSEEGAALAGAGGVDGRGEELLARARLAVDEDGQVGGGEARGYAPRAIHGDALADDVLHGVLGHVAAAAVLEAEAGLYGAVVLVAPEGRHAALGGLEAPHRDVAARDAEDLAPLGLGALQEVEEGPVPDQGGKALALGIAPAVVEEGLEALAAGRYPAALLVDEDAAGQGIEDALEAVVEPAGLLRRAREALGHLHDLGQVAPRELPDPPLEEAEPVQELGQGGEIEAPGSQVDHPRGPRGHEGRLARGHGDLDARLGQGAAGIPGDVLEVVQAELAEGPHAFPRGLLLVVHEEHPRARGEGDDEVEVLGVDGALGDDGGNPGIEEARGGQVVANQGAREQDELPFPLAQGLADRRGQAPLERGAAHEYVGLALEVLGELALDLPARRLAARHEGDDLHGRLPPMPR